MKAYFQTARKEYTCEKCHKVIAKGEQYFRIEGMYMKPRFRCKDCKPERSELTTSDYLSWLWDLQDHLAEQYDFSDPDVAEQIAGDLNDKADELQSQLDNMPEQFQETSDSAMTLQSRIESLQSAASDVECCEYPDEEDDDFQDDDDEPTFELEEGNNSEFLASLFVKDERYTVDEVDEILGAAGYKHDEDAEDEENDDYNSEFDLVYVKDEEKILIHFETRTHFSQDLYDNAVEDFTEQVAEAIGGIEE